MSDAPSQRPHSVPDLGSIPWVIRTLEPLEAHQRVLHVWITASRLIRLLDRWAEVIDEEAAIDEAYYLHEAVFTRVRLLWEAEVNVYSLRGDVDENGRPNIVNRLPPLPNVASDPTWREPGSTYRQQIEAIVKRQDFAEFHRELRILIETLSDSPLQAFLSWGATASPGRTTAAETKIPQITGPDGTAPTGESTSDGEPAADIATEDLAHVVNRLRELGKPMQAKLVEFLASKRPANRHADFETIAERVHGHSKTAHSTVRANVNRTNESLQSMGSRFHLHCASTTVFLKESPK